MSTNFNGGLSCACISVNVPRQAEEFLTSCSIHAALNAIGVGVN